MSFSEIVVGISVTYNAFLMFRTSWGRPSHQAMHRQTPGGRQKIFAEKSCYI